MPDDEDRVDEDRDDEDRFVLPPAEPVPRSTMRRNLVLAVVLALGGGLVALPIGLVLLVVALLR